MNSASLWHCTDHASPRTTSWPKAGASCSQYIVATLQGQSRSIRPCAAAITHACLWAWQLLCTTINSCCIRWSQLITQQPEHHAITSDTPQHSLPPLPPAPHPLTCQRCTPPPPAVGWAPAHCAASAAACPPHACCRWARHPGPRRLLLPRQLAAAAAPPLP
jgi:hypothetical protein